MPDTASIPGFPPTAKLRLSENTQAAPLGITTRSIAHAWPVITVAILIVIYFVHWRWTLAITTPWQCDEIPLLVRFTGLCGSVSTEMEAKSFEPSYYSFYMGAARSLRPPNEIAALHTTTGFWVNLTTHLFGVTPFWSRLIPLICSIGAIGMAAFAAGWFTRNAVVACIAASIVAASPHGIVYAAQARGYAEAMLLAPALLVLLEWFRRNPSDWRRAMLLLICSLHLSLTIYTLWVYWVAPIILLSIFILPRYAETDPRKQLRSRLFLVFMLLVVAMGYFTISRIESLRFTATHKGRPIGSFADLLTLADQTIAHLLPVGLIVVPLGLVGAFAIRRRAGMTPWWVWLTVAGAMTPVLFAFVNGSAGYPRNFGHLVIPFAILAALGLNHVVRFLLRTTFPMAASFLTAALLLGSTALAHTEIARQVQGDVEPDWARAVQAVDRTAETHGPRWFCHSLANHWQINWYRDLEHLRRCLSVPVGGSIEVVLGTQTGEQSTEVIYQRTGASGTIDAISLPHWISDAEASDRHAGVNIRRWRALHTNPSSFVATAEKNPLILILLAMPNHHELPAEIDNRNSLDILTFKPVILDDQRIHSWLLPARHRDDHLEAITSVPSATTRIFQLSPPLT